MQSPLPPHAAMETVSFRGVPTARHCPVTGGLWIRPDAYWAWRAGQPDRFPGLIEDGPAGDVAPTDPAAADSPAGKHCPEDGAFLIRHRVGHGLSMHLDRCGRCGGMWFDPGEWEQLRNHDLLDRLHLIFTSAWQARVRQEQRAQQAVAQAHELFGAQIATTLGEVRELLQHHPRRAEMWAYLTAGKNS